MEFVIDNWYLFAALVFILFMLFGNTISLAMSGIKSINAPEAVQMVNRNDAVMLDVCEVNEYQQGHIPGTINIPLSTLASRYGEVEKYKGQAGGGGLPQRPALRQGGDDAAETGI